MKKILGYLAIIFTVFVLFDLKVSAKKCKYLYESGDDTINYVQIEVDNNGKLTYPFKGDLTSNVILDIDGNMIGHEALNWERNSSYLGYFIGQTYYQNNKKCPPYVVYINNKTVMREVVLFLPNLDDIDVTVIVHASSTFSKDDDMDITQFKLVNEPIEEDPKEDYKVYSCAEIENSSLCEHNNYYSCVWVDTESGGYCNTDNLQYIQCADAFDIPKDIPKWTSFLINLLKIVTPIILIITSIITLVKSLMASKEDEIKKATNILIRRIIAAVLVFLVIYLVQFVITKVADKNEHDNISTCLNCFINNICSSNIYYKTNVGGTYECRYVDNKEPKQFVCPENNQ